MQPCSSKKVFKVPSSGFCSSIKISNFLEAAVLSSGSMRQIIKVKSLVELGSCKKS